MVDQALKVRGDRMRLGREVKGFSLLEAGSLSGVAPSEISRIEGGFVQGKPADLTTLVRLYSLSGVDEVPGDEPEPWWTGSPHGFVGEQYGRGLSYEDSATVLSIYDEYFVPVPLQTRDYAYANQAHRVDVPSAVAEGNIQLRMVRQDRLVNRAMMREVAVTVVLDESVLRRVMALDPRTAAGQLDHIAAISLNCVAVTVRVVPFSAGLCCHVPFVLFGRPRPHAVMLDRLVDVGVDEDPYRLWQYATNFELTRQAALTSEGTLDLVKTLRSEVDA